MKRRGHNIITSDDVSLAGYAGETLSDAIEQLNLLRGNIKWLYQHLKNVNINIKDDVKNRTIIKCLTQLEYDELIQTDLIDVDTVYLIEEE